MMFFVTERRLQAILDADRKEQRMGNQYARDLVDWQRRLTADRDRQAVDVNNEYLRDREQARVAPAVPLTSADDARLVAKKAATKAARPARKPREKK